MLDRAGTNVIMHHIGRAATTSKSASNARERNERSENQCIKKAQNKQVNNNRQPKNENQSGSENHYIETEIRLKPICCFSFTGDSYARSRALVRSPFCRVSMFIRPLCAPVRKYMMKFYVELGRKRSFAFCWCCSCGTQQYTRAHTHRHTRLSRARSPCACCAHALVDCGAVRDPMHTHTPTFRHRIEFSAFEIEFCEAFETNTRAATPFRHNFKFECFDKDEKEMRKERNCE